MARTFSIVTWQAGGGVQPTLGLGRLLSGRGHDVQTATQAQSTPTASVAQTPWSS